ncbi:MAG: serine/threonine-protein kinase [Planctomycetota bacterium]|nr:serine/threonine-protein kinase [Planctomycetota bacterium]
MGESESERKRRRGSTRWDTSRAQRLPAMSSDSAIPTVKASQSGTVDLTATTDLNQGRPTKEPRLKEPVSRLPVLAGRYQMLNIIGYGSYGMVFRGRNVLSGGPVAIKILKSECYGDDFIEGQWAREQDLAARLSIPGSPTGYASGNEELHGSRVSFLVTELVEGQNLKEWRRELKEKPDDQTIMDILRGLVDALCQLEELGVIHRDIKPGNIMLSDNGAIKVMDYGLHRFDDDPPDRSDKMVGTPQYMPPEFISGADGDFASDIYSLGLTLYFVIEGKAPFVGKTVAEVLNKHRKEPLHHLKDDLEDSALDDLIQSMASKKASRRPGIREIQSRLRDPDDIIND